MNVRNVSAKALRIYESGEVPDLHVGRPVSAPVKLVQVSIRSERVYDDDPEAVQTGLKIIEGGLKCIGGRPFMFLVSQRPELRSRVRSKKGLLWDYPEMREMEVERREIERGENRTSLVSLVDLSRYRFDHSSDVVMSWLNGVIVVSELDTDQLLSVAVEWLGEEGSALFALDVDKMFKALGDIAPTAILRYQAADNGWDETLVVAGHERWISSAAIECLRNFSVPSEGSTKIS